MTSLSLDSVAPEPILRWILRPVAPESGRSRSIGVELMVGQWFELGGVTSETWVMAPGVRGAQSSYLQSLL